MRCYYPGVTWAVVIAGFAETEIAPTAVAPDAAAMARLIAAASSFCAAVAKKEGKRVFCALLMACPPRVHEAGSVGMGSGVLADSMCVCGGGTRNMCPGERINSNTLEQLQ